MSTATPDYGLKTRPDSAASEDPLAQKTPFSKEDRSKFESLMELAETLNPGGNLVRRSQAARAADGRAPAIAREDLRARSIWRALERGLACTQADRVQRGRRLRVFIDSSAFRSHPNLLHQLHRVQPQAKLMPVEIVDPRITSADEPGESCAAGQYLAAL